MYDLASEEVLLRLADICYTEKVVSSDNASDLCFGGT
jgi:hypothetical protein